MKLTIYIVFSIFLLISSTITVEAQRRDFLTEAEIELVREYQQIDQRIEILVKAIDRRIAILTNQPSPFSKNSSKWGEEPKGTRTELLWDISKLIEKAVDDIDDLAVREGAMESKFFPKAVHALGDAAGKLIPQLNAILDQNLTEKERGLILKSIDLCNEIIEAAKKIPKDKKKN